MSEQSAVEIEGLTKSFGDTRALDGLDLAVGVGDIVGLLGPNGAGKTTTVRILATLTRPDGGRARVAGADVVAEAELVRQRIGLTGQFAAVDDVLTGRENLEWFGRLRGMSAADASTRATDLLERFGLTDAGEKLARTYSGGMRRRLDLAISLTVVPQVLVLDEPTTGLDPRSRLDLWAEVRALRDQGVTILLTTQYLEEADQLADRIVVIDRGRVIESGTARALKAKVGGAGIDVVAVEDADLPRIAGIVEAVTGRVPVLDRVAGRLSVPVDDGVSALARLARRFVDESVEVDDLSLRRPSLDEVFLALTGAPAPAAENAGGGDVPPATAGVDRAPTGGDTVDAGP